jgi:hypothetical protein
MENFGPEKISQLSVDEAKNNILGIMGVNMQTGRYDEERSVFMGIIAKVEDGKISPDEGLQ